MRMKISPATGSKLIKAVNKAPESEQVRVDVGMTPQLYRRRRRVKCIVLILSIDQALPRFT